MTTIHITKLTEILQDAGRGNPEGFLEIRFDSGSTVRSEEKFELYKQDLRNKIVTASTPYGDVQLSFDGEGHLIYLMLN